jgi:hypothetical protein
MILRREAFAAKSAYLHSQKVLALVSLRESLHTSLQVYIIVVARLFMPAVAV